MSVVNQMLRELDRRHATPNGLAFEATVIPVPPAPRRRWLALGTGVAIAGIAAVVIAHAPPQPERSAPAVAIEPAKPSHLAATRTSPAAHAPESVSSPVAPAAPSARPEANAPRNAPASVPGQGAPSRAAAVPSAQEANAPLSEAAATSLRPGATSAARVTPPKHVEPSREPAAAMSSRSPPLQDTPQARGEGAAVARVEANAPGTVAPPKEQSSSQPAVSRRSELDAPSADRLARLAPAPPAGPSRIEKRVTDQPAQSAAAAFRKAAALIEKGRVTDAKAELRAALAADPDHAAARQTLAALLIEARLLDEAVPVLAEGLARDPAQTNFAVVLARIKVEQADEAGALHLLRAHRGAATGNAQYRAFFAALLHRSGNHVDAIDEYRAALRLAPNVGAWWIGLGLSSEAIDRTGDAEVAFRQARATGTLSADLAELVADRLRRSR